MTKATPDTDRDGEQQTQARLSTHAIHKPGSLGRLHIDDLLKLIEEIRAELLDTHKESWTHRYSELIDVYDNDEDPPSNAQLYTRVTHTVQADSWDELSARLKDDGHPNLINNLEILLTDETSGIRIEIGNFQEVHRERSRNFIVETEETEDDFLAAFAVRLVHRARQKAKRKFVAITIFWATVGAIPAIIAASVANAAQRRGLHGLSLWNEVAPAIIACAVTLSLTAAYSATRITRSQNCYVRANWPKTSQTRIYAAKHLKHFWNGLKTNSTQISVLTAIIGVIATIITLLVT